MLLKEVDERRRRKRMTDVFFCLVSSCCCWHERERGEGRSGFFCGRAQGRVRWFLLVLGGTYATVSSQPVNPLALFTWLGALRLDSRAKETV